MENIITETSIRCLNNDLGTRFDSCFREKTDERTQELRKYVKGYFNLAQCGCAYPPKIFVFWSKRNKAFNTSVFWGLETRNIFPPSDLVILLRPTESEANREASLLGFTKTDKFLESLSPFLEDLDGYSATKVLSREYEFSKNTEDMLVGISKSMSDFRRYRNVLVDILPDFDEDRIIFEKIGFESESTIIKK
jgi:hypothetical protein